jgi:hypothetical protein
MGNDPPIFLVPLNVVVVVPEEEEPPQAAMASAAMTAMAAQLARLPMAWIT